MSSLCFIVESGADVRLVEGLAERFDLTIVARRIEGGVEISHPPAETVPTTIGPASRIKFAVFVWKHLTSNAGKIDRVLVQGYGLAALAANVVGRLKGIKTTMIVCSPAEAYYQCRKLYPDKLKPFRLRELFLIKFIAWLNAFVGRDYIVLSEFLAETVRSRRRRAAVSVIPVYGVDTDLFKVTTEPKHEIRRRLALPSSGALIFFSSRVAPEKDAHTLLGAFKILRDRGRDVWLLHRSGGHQTFLCDAARYGVEDRVIAGDAYHPQHQLPSAYQASDLCVQASRAEGLGFSPLEALACGVPVVAASVGGLCETIIDGVTGWSYSLGDASDLASRIEEALDNEAEAARRTADGRDLVLKKYNKALVFQALKTRLTDFDRLRAEAENPGSVEMRT